MPLPTSDCTSSCRPSRLDDARHDAEPEPIAVARHVGRHADLIKIVVDARQLRRGDADARVRPLRASRARARGLQRSCTLPSLVYLMRIRDEVADHLADRAMHRNARGRRTLSTSRCRPLLAASAANSRRISSNSWATLKSDEFRLRSRPDSQLADVEQRIQQAGHRTDGLLVLLQHFGEGPVFHESARRAVQQRQRLQGLAQVMARGREEAALRLIGAIGFFARLRGAHSEFRGAR